MNDRTELYVHHFLTEGRDESKSHVLLEITQPAPNELETHGHFFAIAELSNATPKTIQMVRAWVEFAIESYYKSVPTNLDSHFELILNQLNTQSSLYLKQHANETIHMAVAAICNTTLHLAIHGKPSALLFYKKDATWNCMDLVDPDSTATPGQLFSNVVNGTMRPDDRFLLATPHVVEFFSPDRIAKISDGKTMSEVNEHMDRVLQDLSSDFSFAGTWTSVVKKEVPVAANTTATAPAAAPVGPKTQTPSPNQTLEELTQIAEPRRAAPTPPVQKKADVSMTDFLTKTKNTSDILAPPVLTIPKDKIVTNVLKIAQRGIESGGKAFVSATKVSISYIKQGREAAIKSPITETYTDRFRSFISRTGRTYATLPQKRKVTLAISLGALLLAGGAIGSVAWMRSNSATSALTQSTFESIEVKLQSADESFTYQNEEVARAIFVEAETLYNGLSEKTRSSESGIALKENLESKRNKIFRRTPIVFQKIETNFSAKSITAAGNVILATDSSGAIKNVKENSSLTDSTTADRIYFDEQNKRLVAQTNNDFSAVSLNGKTVDRLTIERASQDSKTAAATFYSGRLYSYSNETQSITRYDGSGTAYAASKSWITDGSKPRDIVDITADTSLWLRSSNGAVLKYTAGKLQPFAVTGIDGNTTQFNKILTASGDRIILLNSVENRILITERGGKVLSQLVYTTDSPLTSITLDSAGTTIFALTESGSVLSAPLK